MAINKLSSLFCVALAAVYLSGCANDPSSPEEQIRSTLASMEASIEERNNSDLFEHVSETYRDHKGNDKEALRKFAQIYMLRNKNIELFTSIQSLQAVDENTFAIEATVVMGAQADSLGAGLGQLRADSHSVSAVFVRNGDEWLLTSLSWPEQGAY